MIVASHRRSGTHLLMESLRRSFSNNFHLLKTHGLAGEVLSQQARLEAGFSKSIELLDSYDNQPVLYIVRDPRDALTSNFHWWRTSGESNCGGISASFRHITPSQWINGDVGLERVPSENPGCGVSQAHIDLGIFSDPVGFWVKHVSSYLSAQVPMVRFEDLAQQPAKTIRRIATQFGWKQPWWPRKPLRLVGHEPRKGVIGDHRTLFEAHTLAIIEERAGSLMQRLEYLPSTTNQVPETTLV